MAALFSPDKPWIDRREPLLGSAATGTTALQIIVVLQGEMASVPSHLFSAVAFHCRSRTGRSPSLPDKTIPSPPLSSRTRTLLFSSLRNSNSLGLVHRIDQRTKPPKIAPVRSRNQTGQPEQFRIVLFLFKRAAGPNGCRLKKI